MQPTIFRSHKGVMGNHPLSAAAGCPQDHILSRSKIPNSNPNKVGYFILAYPFQEDFSQYELALHEEGH